MSDLVLLIPDWFSSMALVVSGPMLLVALFLLGFALGGRREGIEIRCRRCRHEFARTAPIPDVCQECGASTSTRNALQLGAWRPRWRVLAVAVIALTVGPSLILLSNALPTMKAKAIRAGGIDAAIDAALHASLANPQSIDLQQLHDALHTPDEGADGTDARWLRFAERIEREPAARPLAMQYLGFIGTWGNAPNTRLAASDKALETFGRALATALKSDPSLVDVWRRELGMQDDLPAILFEPFVGDHEVSRVFLRGPVLSAKYRVREGRNDLRVLLLHGGMNVTRRSLEFESVELSYGRQDGTAVSMTQDPRRMGGFRPELDETFGTAIDLTRPLADATWDGTIRIDARIGHAPANKFGRIARNKASLEDVFDHAWEIRVERVDPAKIRVFPVSESNASELVTASLRDVAIKVKPSKESTTATVSFNLEPMSVVNGVVVNLDTTIAQESRTWTVRDGADNEVDGFESGRPFELLVQGVAPQASASVDDVAYLAGRWTARYEVGRSTPFEVIFTRDPKAAQASNPELNPELNFGAEPRGVVIPGATVGPKRPTADAALPAQAK